MSFSAKSFIPSFVAILMVSFGLVTAGCGGAATGDASVEISADDPYLVESAEVTSYEPQSNGGEEEFAAP